MQHLLPAGRGTSEPRALGALATFVRGGGERSGRAGWDPLDWRASRVVGCASKRANQSSLCEHY
jgi:hypothetical protein